MKHEQKKMSKQNVIWVYPSGDVWVVKKAGTSKASAIRNTKKEAYDAARNIALNQNLNIKIREANGSLRNVTPKQARDNNCFITTACVKYYGLGDNCYQLKTLRKFRDEYLSKSSENSLLVDQYYSVAPRLVIQMESDRNKGSLYKTVFEKINAACSAIESKRFEEAKSIYKEAVFYLLNYFKGI